MPDWTSSMQQTYEYYIVDPGTWKDMKRIATVTACTIDRDSTVDTLGSGSFDISDLVGECYIRAYLITIQNGITEKHPLGTLLVQTPSSDFDGKRRVVSMDAYTPLIELKEGLPPIGYSKLKGDNIMDSSYDIVRTNVRAPVVKPTCSTKLQYDFVADLEDTWMSFTKDLISNAKYEFVLDEMGRILFAPKQETAALQPVWTYTDGDNSIMHPDITMNHDLYGIPNVIEVVYSNGADKYYKRVVNDDPNSPTSTVNRGREIVYRDTSPSIVGDTTDEQLQEYAERRLKELSVVEYTISYTHGYCPVRVGDCVRLNYKRAGLTDIKAKVISQSIKCEPGCPVKEKAVFTTKLWG